MKHYYRLFGLILLLVVGSLLVMRNSTNLYHLMQSEISVKKDVINYLVGEAEFSPNKAEDIYNQFSKHEDILKEFHRWIKERKFLDEINGGIEVRGYTAKRVIDEAKINITPVGVYSFLVALRKTSNPESLIASITHKVCGYGRYRAELEKKKQDNIK